MNVNCPNCGKCYEIEKSGEYQCGQCQYVFYHNSESDDPSAKKTCRNKKKSVLLVQTLNGVGYLFLAVSVLYVFIGFSSAGQNHPKELFCGIFGPFIGGLLFFSTARIIYLLEIIAKNTKTDHPF